MKSMNSRQTLTIAAIVAFIIIFAWGRDAESAELGLGLSAGASSHSSGAKAQEISITTDDYRWYGQVMRIGGDGILSSNWRYSAGYRLFWRRDHDFKPFLRLGVAYFDDVPELVSERFMYDMGVGIRWREVIEAEYNHNSTAGRSAVNTGIDFVTLRLVFQFDL